MTRRPSGTRAYRLLLLFLAAVLFAGCSGIPGSSPVTDVTTVAEQNSQQAPATPDPGMTPDAIVRGFIYAAARISLGGTGSAYAAPSQYLTVRAAQQWQKKPAAVVILPDQFRVDPSADPTAFTIGGPVQGTLDVDRAFHSSYDVTYKVVVHLVKENGQWRISDPPAELLIRQSDFSTVFSVRTLYFLDASRSVVVPDRRYLINGGTPDNNVVTLMNLLLHGPAGVLKNAAQSELTGANLRTKPATSSAGLTLIDLQGIDNLQTAADKNALAAQVVWTLSTVATQFSINVNGAPLDSAVPIYKASSVESFSPDRVPGSGSVASDPYFIDDAGGIVDLLTRKALYGGVGTSFPHVVSASMSAATGTLAAVSDVQNIDGTSGQQLLIGQPLAYQQPVPALRADTLTQPSFSRSGDEVWVVQNGGDRNPEIYQISTGQPSSTGTTSGGASRAKVASTTLAGKGQVTSFVLSPDGVRVAIVAGGKLYIGAIAETTTTARSQLNTTAPADDPTALALVNLGELRGDLSNVGPVAFQSANQLLVVSNNLPGYRSIKDVRIDGSDVTQVTTDSQFGDVTSMAVSVVDSTATTTDTSDPNQSQSVAALVYVILGQPGSPGPVLKLQGSLTEGKWVPADASSPTAVGLFYPN